MTTSRSCGPEPITPRAKASDLAESQRWCIELFGGLRAVRGDLVVTRFRTRKTALLLAWLALHLQRPHPREELIDMLWPDASASSGRNSLSRALSALRQALEPPGVPPKSVILATRADVQLSPASVETDAARFSSRLAEAAGARGPKAITTLEAAVQQHRGPLLPGVYVDGVLEARRRFAAAHLAALLDLVQLYLDSGEPQQALDRALAATAADPLSEEATRAAMRVYAALGEPAAGLRRYEALQEALRRDLELAPTEASQRLADTLQGTGARRSALPAVLSRFFGREDELRELTAWAGRGEDRLRTLTGPSGSGKTRLALEAGRAFAASNPAPAWFVPLADLAEDSAVRARFATATGQRGDALEHIATALGEGALLIVDNAEHLAERTAAVVSELLQAAPTLRCLVTSQRRLGLAGERERPLAPLGLPDADPQDGKAPGVLAEVARSPAVALFVDRVASLRPGFALTRENAVDVVRICACLDGIPLALELAAGRAHVLSPRQLRERLEAGVARLAQRDPTAPARHRTLEAAFGWSFDLLEPSLQRALCRLSIFRGGWTLAAAEHVCEDPLVIDHLADLAEVSLIERVEADEPAWQGDADRGEEGGVDLELAARFRMLECVRRFARSRVPEADLEALSARHADHFTELAEHAAAALRQARDGRIFDRLQRDHENCAAALQWLAQDPARAGQGLELAVALSAFWTARGHTVEGSAWLDALLALGTRPDAVRANALRIAGNLLWTQGRPCRDRFEESLSLFRELGDSKGTAHALNGLGIAHWAAGELSEAETAFIEGLRIWEDLVNEPAAADAQNNLGLIAMGRADYAEARRWFLLSLKTYEREGSQGSCGRSLNNLGTVMQEQGDLPEALGFFRRALELFETLGDRRGAAYAMHNEAAIHRLLGEHEPAERLATRALEAFRQLSDKRGIANCYRVLADIARDRGDHDEARAAYLQAIRLGRDAGDQEGPLDCVEGLAGMLVVTDPTLAARLMAGVAKLRASDGVAAAPSGEPERAACRTALAQRLEASALTEAKASAPTNWEELLALIHAAR